MAEIQEIEKQGIDTIFCGECETCECKKECEEREQEHQKNWRL